MNQVCNCSDGFGMNPTCPIHGEPAPSTITTNSNEEWVYIESQSSKEEKK